MADQESRSYLGERDLILGAPLPERTKTLYLIASETGASLSLIAGLRVRDIDFRRHAISLEGRRVSPLSEKAIGTIRTYAEGLGDADFLFRSREGGHLSTRRIQQELETVSQALGRAVSRRTLEAERRRREAEASEERIELERLLVWSADRREETILRTVHETGLKGSQVCALTAGDLDPVRGRVKGIPVSWKLIELLEELAAGGLPDERLFRTRQSAAMTPRRLQQLLRRLGVTSEELRRGRWRKGRGGDRSGR
ncbi:hypothetical protein JXB02_00030 [Candidatus Woesearchaeota archaeon]|nr:hypothetical protein [Candidatus Woesearchaeota archaeon]